MAAAPISQRGFIAVSALLFTLSAAVTIVWCGSMSAMGAMPMPGGWTLSMAWMPMCGQSWADAAVSFIAMWVVMMVGMMLPSLAPMLWRYRQDVGGTDTNRLGLLTALVGAGYFLVWTLFGITAFPVGAALASATLQIPALARVVPVAAGAVVVAAGMLQFSVWKARHLAFCRGEPRQHLSLSADARDAMCHGLRFGLHCSYSCAGPTAILLVVGVMDLRAMAVVMAAITAERLAPGGRHIARITGAMIVLAGLCRIAQAAGLIPLDLSVPV